MKSLAAAVSFSLVSSQFNDVEADTGVRQKRRPDVIGAAKRMLLNEPLPEPALPPLGASHLVLVAERLCPACAGEVHEYCSHGSFEFVFVAGALQGSNVLCSCEHCRGGVA